VTDPDPRPPGGSAGGDGDLFGVWLEYGVRIIGSRLCVLCAPRAGRAVLAAGAGGSTVGRLAPPLPRRLRLDSLDIAHGGSRA
jgi:hypothetical protein